MKHGWNLYWIIKKILDSQVKIAFKPIKSIYRYTKHYHYQIWVNLMILVISISSQHNCRRFYHQKYHKLFYRYFCNMINQ